MLRLRALLSILALALVSACKVTVIVPPGGKVINEDGFVCLAGETCEINVTDTNFDATFVAMPEDGVTFQRWKKGPARLCGGKTTSCALSTTGFPGHDNLMAILASDDEFFLEPIFIKYDVGYWKKVVAQIKRNTFATRAFLYAVSPIVAQCDPGGLKQNPKSRVVESLNQARLLHGLGGVSYRSSYDGDVQASSLVQRANNKLDHTPDPTDKCYTQAAADAAATSNLSAAQDETDPASDVFLWIDDSFNAPSQLMVAGHRRWMLYPPLDRVAYGQVEGFSTLKVFGFDTSANGPVPVDLDYVAMPYRDYPYILVSQHPNPTPWSISIVPPGDISSNFDYFTGAQISVLETDTGKNMNVSRVHQDNRQFGLANFLSWIVDGWDYDVPYTVKISNIRVMGGGTRDIEYPVRVDRYSLFNAAPPTESTDSRQDRTMEGRFNTPKDEDGYPVLLNREYSVTGSSEFANWGFYVRVYNSDKKLVASFDEPFSMKFPWDDYSVIVSPCNEEGRCYPTTKTYMVTFN